MRRASRLPRPDVLISLLAAFSLAALLETSASAQDFDHWCWEADEVHARVDEDALIIFHDAALYNCCPDPFDYTVSLEGSTIRVRESEVLTEPCYCICCFDLAVTIEGLPPGDYELEFSWYDYEGEAWLARWLEVAIPDAGQAHLPAVADRYNSGCLAAQAVPETASPEPDDEEPPSWGRIKALFD
jgi:hypothetical protein